MTKRENEFEVSIKIFDNNEWQPDLDFSVEIFDPTSKTKERLYGDDTKAKVTILDEDFPGKLGFDNTEISVSKF
jgi:hypothetical protein